MIPQEKSEAVTRGLREAFGVTAFEDIRVLSQGSFSKVLVFRIVVREKPYLLRIILRTDDPARHFACMNAAADAGLAPQVRYTSVEDKLSITDFVQAVPFSAADALVGMPTTLRALHALPPFPRIENHINTSCMFLLNEGPALDAILRRCQAVTILPKSESEELFALHAQVAAIYPRDGSDMVSSHNDLFKPDNILFDGNRVWLVDWEAAFLNDRYADLAVVANLLVTNETEERIFLQEYFGRAPDQYQLARFFLMQQVAHIFYTMAFLLLSPPDNPPDQNVSAPEFREFHRRFWAGEFKLEDSQTKALYGRAHLAQLFQNARQPRFGEALRIVSDRHTRV
jgi:aminoglycoside phosphotransferase (APT) family kinase protein